MSTLDRAVRRLLPTVVVVALLAATAAAFAIAERLKLEPAAITQTRVDQVFSPVCECPDPRANISFRLRRADRLTVSILDEANDRVATLVDGGRFAAGPVALTWDGRDEAGRLAPEAVYHPRVELERNGRTIQLPNPIRVDLTPPRVLSLAVSPQVISPDGDGRSDRLEVAYELSERAIGYVFVNGERRIRALGRRPAQKVNWYGKVGGASVPEGEYEITVIAEDEAGNRSQRGGPRRTRVRYVDLARHRIIVPAGFRFGVGVDTDAPRVRWRLGRRSGSAPAGLLKLRAPRQPGQYTLVVTVRGHSERAAVFVRPRAQ